MSLPRLRSPLGLACDCAFGLVPPHACSKRPDDIGQYAAMADVLDVLRRIDAREHVKFRDLAVFLGFDLEYLARLDAARQAGNRVTFAAGQAKARAILAVDELKREHAHPDQIAAMDTLETFRNDRAHAEQLGTLGSPVA